MSNMTWLLLVIAITTVAGIAIVGLALELSESYSLTAQLLGFVAIALIIASSMIICNRIGDYVKETHRETTQELAVSVSDKNTITMVKRLRTALTANDSMYKSVEVSSGAKNVTILTISNETFDNMQNDNDLAYSVDGVAIESTTGFKGAELRIVTESGKPVEIANNGVITERFYKGE